MKRKNKKNSGLKFILLLLLLIGATGIYFGVSYLDWGAPRENIVTVKIPTMQVALTSSSNSEAYDVQASFTLEIDADLRDDVTSSELQSYIREIMTTLEYDEVVGSNGVDYVKSEIRKRLVDYLSEEQIHGIYVTNLDTSETLPPLSTEDPQRGKVFEELFPRSR